MKKKLIKKVMFDSVEEIDDDILSDDWKEKTKNSKIIRFEYNGFVAFYPVSKETYQGKTKAELYAKFIKNFIKSYDFAKKELEAEKRNQN